MNHQLLYDENGGRRLDDIILDLVNLVEQLELRIEKLEQKSTIKEYLECFGPVMSDATLIADDRVREAKMTTQEKKLEKRILALVKADAGTTVQLVSKLRDNDPSISESVARRMVWRLVDRGQISLTQNRTLAIPE